MRQGKHRPSAAVFNPREPSAHQASRVIYRFADIEVNSFQGCLKRGGKEQYIRQQSFHVLLYLLHERERVVTKEELLEHFWEDTAVTDNALVQCIADIRKVLGDDSRHARFIKTVPKVGYRFIGAIEVDQPDVHRTIPPEEITAYIEPEEDTGFRRMQRHMRVLRKSKLVAVGIVAAVLVVSFLTLRFSRRRLDLALPGSADAITNSFEAYRYYSLGLGKAETFENAEAVSLLKKAVELDPKFAMAYARIGYAYSVTDFLPDKGRPYLEKAFQLSDSLTQKDRMYVTAWYAIAREDYPDAIHTLQQLLRQYPLEIEAYARLARLLYREERSQKAISVIYQGLSVDPDAGDLYNVLGICFLGLHRYHDAIAAHERYMQLCPKEPNAHDSLGMSYQQSGRYADAIAEYNAALLLNPKFEPAIIHLADTYSQQGRYRDGIREYQRYVQVTQSNTARAVAYGSIAQIYRRKRDSRLGEQAALYATAYDPGAVWNSLLFALDRGDMAKASRLRERLFEDSPYPERGVRHELRSYEYYFGTLALKNNQSSEAVAHFKEALQHLPPSSGLDLYEDCLANAYLELGRLDDAINEYERVVSLNPNYPLAQYHLAQAYNRKGELQQARAAYLRFSISWKDADRDTPEVIEAEKALYPSVARNR